MISIIVQTKTPLRLVEIDVGGFLEPCVQECHQCLAPAGSEDFLLEFIDFDEQEPPTVGGAKNDVSLARLTEEIIDGAAVLEQIDRLHSSNAVPRIVSLFPIFRRRQRFQLSLSPHRHYMKMR
jgi:hypothetical protein